MADLRDHYDVIVIGAGLSGIGMAAQLKTKTPDRSFVVLERRERMGGTWDLFRYPGIRSDSDMYTFGFGFRPWRDSRAIAPGAAIRDYLQGTIDDYGLQAFIRFRTGVTRANWSSSEKLWHLSIEEDGETRDITAGFVVTATGYYNYEHGYRPEIPGLEDFSGQRIHPQFWPEDFDHSGKRIVVIGSGATAVTLVPALAETAAHVTMLQRSPTYIFDRPSVDHLSDLLSKFLPARVSYPVIRLKNAVLGTYLFNLSRRKPAKVRHWLRGQAVQALGKDYDVDRHFNPEYEPWDQRLCVIPDSDLFSAIRSGRASVVTDQISRVVEDGIELQSGDRIDADVIVTATGLDLQFLGGMALSLDGEPVNPADHLVYRGMMLENVPNMVAVFGYSNASWTLKADLTSDYVCRLLNKMRKTGKHVAVACLGDEPRPVAGPLIGLQSGYIMRAADRLPKQGDRMPWQNHDNWFRDYRAIRWGGFDDGTLRLS